ncbi:hypothetical protein V6574_28280 [Streptomyces sp. SM1P]
MRASFDTVQDVASQGCSLPSPSSWTSESKTLRWTTAVMSPGLVCGSRHEVPTAAA